MGALHDDNESSPARVCIRRIDIAIPHQDAILNCNSYQIAWAYSDERQMTMRLRVIVQDVKRPVATLRRPKLQFSGEKIFFSALGAYGESEIRFVLPAL